MAFGIRTVGTTPLGPLNHVWASSMGRARFDKQVFFNSRHLTLQHTNAIALKQPDHDSPNVQRNAETIYFRQLKHTPFQATIYLYMAG